MSIYFYKEDDCSKFHRTVVEKYYCRENLMFIFLLEILLIEKYT